MSERMTDERLAEIERAVFDVEGWPVNCSEELLQALKAERAEVARLKEWQDAFIAAKDGTDTALVSAESKLRAVGELPGKWTEQAQYEREEAVNHAIRIRADELEARLK